MKRLRPFEWTLLALAVLCGIGAFTVKPLVRELDPELALSVADRIDEVLSSGDLTLAHELVKTLPPDFPYAARIRELTEDFDLSGLEVLTKELRSKAR